MGCAFLCLALLFLVFCADITCPSNKKVIKEPFFGENIPANPELIKSGLSEVYTDEGYVDCVHKGVETMFDYSDRFIEAQMLASRIYVLPPYQSGEVVCS